MEKKTKVHAEEGKQDIIITRDFDLPVELLFKAHVDPELIEQWMGSKAVVFEAEKQGRWQLEKKDEHGNKVFGAHGTFHDLVPNQKMTRTFEMENASMDVQLEFFEFEKLSDETSRLTMQIIYRSADHREKQLKMPFAAGINYAHNQLEEVISKLK